MTVVICDEHKCKFNQDGVCHAEAIHIVSYREAWDCTQFERGWAWMTEETESDEAHTTQNH